MRTNPAPQTPKPNQGAVLGAILPFLFSLLGDPGHASLAVVLVLINAPPPRTLQYPYAQGPMVVLGGSRHFLMGEVPL